MCGNSYKVAKEPLKVDKITEGEWIINGDTVRVLDTGYSYDAKFGNSGSEYYIIRGPKGEKRLLTAHRFTQEAKRPAPRPKLSITYRQLLAGAPCTEGLHFIAYLLGGSYPSNEALFLNVTERAIKVGIDTKFDLTNLYAMFKRAKAPGEGMTNEWLRYVAEQLKVVPKGMHHDTTTLLRLLGIEE